MSALLIVGPAVEVLLGKIRFLALYLIAGFGGSVARTSWARQRGRAGASGAIMGVMGAYVVLAPTPPAHAPVVGLIVLNLVIGFAGNIDWRAHLGGLATGAVLAFVYDNAGTLRDRSAGAGPDRRRQRGRPGGPGLSWSASPRGTHCEPGDG